MSWHLSILARPTKKKIQNSTRRLLHTDRSSTGVSHVGLDQAVGTKRISQHKDETVPRLLQVCNLEGGSTELTPD